MYEKDGLWLLPLDWFSKYALYQFKINLESKTGRDIIFLYINYLISCC